MSRRTSSSRIYVGNLPDDIGEREIEDIFYKFGRIRDIDIKCGRNSNGTAYAFVEFEDPRDAEDAVYDRDGYKFCGGRLRVEFTGERRPRRIIGKASGPPKRTEYRVIVTGLPQSASWQDLKDHMRQAGPVGYANIEHGTGVVEYEKASDMEWALRRLDRSEFKNIFHCCCIRVRRDERRSSSRSRSGYGKRYRGRSRSRSTSLIRSRSASSCNRGRYDVKSSRGRTPCSDKRCKSIDSEAGSHISSHDRRASSHGRKLSSHDRSPSSHSRRPSSHGRSPSSRGRSPSRDRSPSSRGRSPSRNRSPSSRGRSPSRNRSPSSRGRSPNRRRSPSRGRSPSSRSRSPTSRSRSPSSHNRRSVLSDRQSSMPMRSTRNSHIEDKDEQFHTKRLNSSRNASVDRKSLTSDHESSPRIRQDCDSNQNSFSDPDKSPNLQS